MSQLLRASELAQRAAADRPKDGADFAKFIWALVHNQSTAGLDVATEKFLSSAPRVNLAAKAAVDAYSTLSPGFVDSFSWKQIAGEIIALAATQTVLGRIGPSMRRVPFNTMTLVQATPANADWVAQGKPKPVATFVLETITLRPAKVPALVLFTQELMRTLSPATQASIVNAVVSAIAKFADQALLDPNTAPIAGENPASLTYGIAAVPSTGSTAAQISTDLRNLLQGMIASGSDLTGVVLVVHPTTALYLSGLLTTGGDLAFPNMGALGGEIWGIPVLTSLACEVQSGSPTYRQIVAIDPTRVLLADDGRMAIDSSRESSLQAVSDPATGATAQISLWQHNLVSMRVERYVSWERADDNAVQVLSGVNY